MCFCRVYKSENRASVTHEKWQQFIEEMYGKYLGCGVNVGSVIKQESNHVELSKVTCRVQWSVASLHSHSF